MSNVLDYLASIVSRNLISTGRKGPPLVGLKFWFHSPPPTDRLGNFELGTVRPQCSLNWTVCSKMMLEKIRKLICQI